jgi:hypothetical protein
MRPTQGIYLLLFALGMNEVKKRAEDDMDLPVLNDWLTVDVGRTITATSMSNIEINNQLKVICEAHSLAENMEAMANEHEAYRDYYAGLKQDLGVAKRKFLVKREIERAQLMTGALAGMLTIRSMFEELRERILVPNTHEDPITSTLHFEARVLDVIKFFTRKLYVYASLMTDTVASSPILPRMVDAVSATPRAANTPTTNTATTNTNAATPQADSAAEATPPFSDEEVARQMQEADDAEYAQQLSRRV